MKSTLATLDPKQQLKMIFDAPAPETIVQALSAVELYAIIDAVGLESSFEVFQLATPEQARVILDLDLWDEWSISVEKTVRWLDQILTADSNYALRLLAQLDQELLMILLKKSLTVGGGLSDIIYSEDFNGDWDHTFDEIFFLQFVDSENCELILKMLELLYHENHRLYRSLMLGAENELLTELEDTAYQFRMARLEDEGICDAH
jgi:hypothetical protein